MFNGRLRLDERMVEDWAAEKSGARVGSLGEVRVELAGTEAPWNCEERSVCCERRRERWSWRIVAALEGVR